MGEAKQKDFIYPKLIYCGVFSQKLSFFQAQTQAAGLPLGNVVRKSEGYFSKDCEGGAAFFFFLCTKSCLWRISTFIKCFSGGNNSPE